jgi:hypothetical protein
MAHSLVPYDISIKQLRVARALVLEHLEQKISQAKRPERVLKASSNDEEQRNMKSGVSRTKLSSDFRNLSGIGTGKSNGRKYEENSNGHVFFSHSSY